MLCPPAGGTDLAYTDLSCAVWTLIHSHSFKLRTLAVFSPEILSILLFIKITQYT